MPTEMDLSLMEDLSDAEAMDEEEPPPKYRPSVGVRSSVVAPRVDGVDVARRRRRDAVDAATRAERAGTPPRRPASVDAQASTSL